MINKKLVFIILIFGFLVGYPNQVFCAADLPLLGRWLDSNQKKGYEFIEGFGPNVGVVLILENSKVKDIYKWTLYPEKQTIKFRYGEKTISLKGNNLILNNKTFQKDKVLQNKW